MLYIYMLGYDADFGHMEVVSLISAPKYPEKQVGNIGGREFAESLAPDVQRLLLYYGVDESYKLSNIPASGDPMYGHIEVGMSFSFALSIVFIVG
ncbi:hypothetical protein J5N97_010281 [Dioscorea zingiberensis]|uniref:Uncharacterized protein n=1 Tax=Dioscorea zingiberensis TaxID=325984 RepID=A0A9D5CYF8_9LILI|nr:hypothetical protein J5N97_010281 [Dioscorea zingiberensis]